MVKYSKVNREGRLLFNDGYSYFIEETHDKNGYHGNILRHIITLTGYVVHPTFNKRFPIFLNKNILIVTYPYDIECIL